MPYDLHILFLFRLVVGSMNACKPPQSTRVKNMPKHLILGPPPPSETRE